MGLAVGVFVAVSGGGQTHNVNDAAFGSPTTSPSASATTVAPANSFASGAIATQKLGDVATAPVDGAGNTINLHQSAAQALASMNCTLAVPANPLTATGLATPWQLGDGCTMLQAGTEGAFVGATILAPNGSLQVYSPLVVTAGTQPAVAPTPPTIAAGSVVEISIGFNGTNLALTGAGANEGNCVDALGQSLIGQVSACNAVNFYQAANADIARGTLKVPPAGTSKDGQACLTTRSFATIDQDQSDNVVSQYLITANGQTAQNSPANNKALAGATVLTNGTIAVIPPNDEMVLVGGNMSIAKTNVYRSLVDQPLLATNTNPATVAASYCQNMVNIQPARNQLDYATEFSYSSPVPATGNNLATFMANRLSMSFVNLNCSNYGLTNPVNVTLDGNGVATAGSYVTTEQTATGAATTTQRTVNPFQGQTTGTQARNPFSRDREEAVSGA